MLTIAHQYNITFVVEWFVGSLRVIYNMLKLIEQFLLPPHMDG